VLSANVSMIDSLGKGVIISAIEAFEMSRTTQGIVVGEVISLDENGLIINCNEGALQITCLQLPGKKAMLVSELMNGYQDYFSIGSSFE
jgi:methionyl-tRNA formyltransferase